jgi:hypothetical protein
MSLRTLPFRQYNETDVINMFALGTGFVNESVTDSSATSYGDAGVFVTIESGNLNVDTITYDNAYASYLGKTNYPYVGANQYPRVSISLKPATSGDALIGMTLRQTAKNDENGEKLLYYPQKAEELMCMLPGQAVPVATRGIFTLDDSAFTVAIGTGAGQIGIGGGLALSSGTSGRLTGCAITNPARVALVIATGSRTYTASTANLVDPLSGSYAIIGLGL